MTDSSFPGPRSRFPLARIAVVGRHASWSRAAALAAILSAPALSGLAFQAPTDPSPATGDARVIAQGVLPVGPGDVVWQVTQASAPPPANAAPVDARAGFLIANDGAMLVEREGDDQVRLAAGEATLTRAGERELRAALGSNAVGYAAIELAPADAPAPEAGFTGPAFAADGARHDIDLVADSLVAGETVAVPAGAGPTLVLLTAGAADLTTDAGEVVGLAAGDAATIDGAFTATAGEAGAAVVAAVLGPEVPQLSEQPRVATEGTPAAVVEVGSASPVPATAATAADDEDADGLTAAEEDELNTDPLLADTDGDGLSDGDEVNLYQTLPLADDSDADGVFDGDEVAAGADPATGAAAVAAPAAAEPVDPAPVEPAIDAAAEPAPTVVEEPAPVVEAPVDPGIPGDADGDFLPDVDEAAIGTDPFNGDTDADGLLDGSEVFDLQLGPLNPDNDGDGVLDGDEVNNGTDPNDPGSF